MTSLEQLVEQINELKSRNNCGWFICYHCDQLKLIILPRDVRVLTVSKWGQEESICESCVSFCHGCQEYYAPSMQYEHDDCSESKSSSDDDHEHEFKNGRCRFCDIKDMCDGCGHFKWKQRCDGNGCKAYICDDCYVFCQVCANAFCNDCEDFKDFDDECTECFIKRENKKKKKKTLFSILLPQIHKKQRND